MKYKFKKYKFIYVDSAVAIKYLKSKTNLKSHTLISFNPALVLDKSLNVLGLENNSSPKDFIKLGKKPIIMVVKFLIILLGIVMILIWVFG